MLARLRDRKDYSQVRAAEALCAASGITTVTRHEVSQWERQERIPIAFWLRWLAVVLEAPPEQMEAARREITVYRRGDIWDLSPLASRPGYVLGWIGLADHLELGPWPLVPLARRTTYRSSSVRVALL